MVDLLEREQSQDQNSGDDEKTVSDSELNDLEKNADEPASSSGADTPSLYTGGDETRNSSSQKKPSNKKKSSRNKKIGLIVGGIGGAGLITLGWFILAVLGSLLVPQLAQHIIEYEFVNATSQFSENAARVTDEKLAVDSISSDAVYDGVEAEYGSGGASSLWSAFDKYRPNKVISNLETGDSGLALNYKTTATGRSVLTSVDIGVDSIDVVQQGWTKFIPGVNSIIDFKNDVNLSKQFAPDLIDALKADDVGTIVRSIVAYQLRQRLGIGLFAWTTGRLANAYADKTPAEADNAETKDKIDTIDENLEPDVPLTVPIAQADSDVEATVQQTESTNAGLKEIEDNNGEVPDIGEEADADLSSIGSRTLSVTGIIRSLSPLYSIALPLCIIYDGSMTKDSGATIDNATDQQMRAFSFIESAADQEKSGSPTVNSEAVGALNNDLESEGNIGLSNPELRSGGEEVDTSNMISAESSADGQYTLFDTLMPSPVAKFMDVSANTLCPLATSLKTGVALIALNLTLKALFPEGDAIAEASAGAVDDAASEAGTDVAADIAEGTAIGAVTQESAEATNDSLLSRGVSLVYDLKSKGKEAIKTAAKISGLTLVAKVVVMSKASQFNSGTAQGIDLANEADSGGNIYANTISQNLNYGRPLDEKEVAQTAQSTQNDLVASIAKESVYQRYFALSNADSLFSHLGMDVYEHFNGSLLPTIFSSISKIFNPIRILSSIFGSITSKPALAENTVANTDYGNVQFGWSQSEENLINSSSTYQPLENQKVLDASGDEAAIASTYGVCFTDTIGQLLSSGDIVRDSKGNVLDNQGLCSPNNLSNNNTTLDASGKKLGDLVFRWRLSMAYQNTLDQFDAESSLANQSQ